MPLCNFITRSPKWSESLQPSDVPICHRHRKPMSQRRNATPTASPRLKFTFWWQGAASARLSTQSPAARCTTACGLAHTRMHIRTHVNQHQRHCKKISLDLVAAYETYIPIDAMTQYHPCCNVFFFNISGQFFLWATTECCSMCRKVLWVF